MNTVIVYDTYKKTSLYVELSRLIIILICFYSSPLIIYSETEKPLNLLNSSSSVSKDRNYIINATLDQYYSKDIINALKEGFSSEIIFNIRISRKRKGLETILRNPITTEYFEKRLVRYNPYERNYSINLEKLYFHRSDKMSNNQLSILRKKIVDYSENLELTTKEELIYFLFSLKDMTLKTDLPATKNDHLSIKVILTTIKLAPPLHLISLFKDGIQIESNWQSIPNTQLQKSLVKNLN